MYMRVRKIMLLSEHMKTKIPDTPIRIISIAKGNCRSDTLALTEHTAASITTWHFIHYREEYNIPTLGINATPPSSDNTGPREK